MRKWLTGMANLMKSRRQHTGNNYSTCSMSNPANFGMAKSFFMMGKARGFDMYTQEGLDEWMMTYNTELMAGTGQRVPSPFIPSISATFDTYGGSSGISQVQPRQKMARVSRKRNRKRKS
jgi:hypothetical protein